VWASEPQYLFAGSGHLGFAGTTSEEVPDPYPKYSVKFYNKFRTVSAGFHAQQPCGFQLFWIRLLTESFATPSASRAISLLISATRHNLSHGTCVQFLKIIASISPLATDLVSIDLHRALSRNG